MAHIVKTEPGEDAAGKVLEARIYGTPLEALCGHVWIPSRDPKQLPLCDKCKDPIVSIVKPSEPGIYKGNKPGPKPKVKFE